MRLLVLSAALLVLSCADADVSPTPRTAEAARLLDAYLHALRGRSADYGWSLLHPDARMRVVGGLTEYLADARAARWHEARWALGEVRRDDDLYCARLDILEGAVPEFLTRQENTILAPVPEGRAYSICAHLRGDEVGVVGG